MIAGIYEWVKNIAFYMILITAVLNLLPDNSYKQYIRLFIGMIMVILVLSPVSRLFGFSGRLDLAFIKNMYSQEMSGKTRNIHQMLGEQEELIVKRYKEEIILQVEDLIRQEGYYPVDIQVTMNQDDKDADFGGIEAVRAVISDREQKEGDIMIQEIRIENSIAERPEEIIVKKAIEDFYNIGPDNIHVSIQR